MRLSNNEAKSMHRQNSTVTISRDRYIAVMGSGIQSITFSCVGGDMVANISREILWPASIESIKSKIV